MRKVPIIISEDVKKRLQIQAIEAGVSMGKYAEDLLTSGMDKDAMSEGKPAKETQRVA